MNIALGFGSTEQAFEAAEEEAIRAHIESRYSELDLSYFTDAFVDEIRTWVKDRGWALQAKGNEYKNATEYPPRYSYYWPSVVADASHIVVILRVHHINRRHPLSPDGWAAMQSKPVFLFENLDTPSPAQGIDARSGTTGTGVIGEADESPVPEGNAPNA